MTYRKLSLRPLNAMLKQALHSRALRRAALGAGALAPAFALANPTGGQVVGGSASITVPDANHTIINQASQSAILNWQQFSIGSNQYVQFIQPDSSSVVLNRVIGGNPSQILGNLSANGQVFLVNPNGVFFGQTATLDVQGLVATTLDIKDSDFMAGHYAFAKANGAPDASVVNQGNISANGGYVVLAGDYVENDGVINAQAGTVVLAAGNQMALTLNNNALVSFVVDQATLAQYAGVSNTGSIIADGGEVLMTAKVANALTATAVNNSGLVTAHSIQNHNGTIILAAKGGDIEESGTLDASATQSGVAGGYIRIRGNAHTDIASTASINAAGDNARGGFVELSGHHLKVNGNVNPGNGGSLLIDPMKLYITSGGASHGSWTSGDWVSTSFIDSQLNLGVSLTLIASNSVAAPGTPPGDAGATAATNITATGTGNLTIKTGTTQIHSLGSAGDSLKSCNRGVCYGLSGASTATYGFTATKGNINLTGLNINIAGTFTASAGSPLPAIGVGTVTLGNVTAKSIKVTGGPITVGNLVTSGTAGIYIKAYSPSYGGPAINLQAGSLTATGAGGVTLIQSHGTHSFSGSGGAINVTGAISAAGAVNITAHDTNGNSGGNINLQSVTGKSVTIATLAKKAANIYATSLHANGLAISDGVAVTASANGGVSSSGGNITINSAGGIIADHGAVTLTAKGGLDSGGKVTVNGAITAAGGVTVNATNIGTYSGAYIKVGNVTGAFVHITGKGLSPSISAGSLTATGATGSNSVALRLYNATGVSSAAAGAIKVSGAIKSSHGSVMFMGGKHATITDTGTITAGTVVTLQGKNISATGNITAAGSMAATATHSTGTSAATITLGNVTAKKITLFDKGANTIVNAGALTANGAASTDNVNITLFNAAGTGSAAAGAVNISGAVKSSHGGVTLKARNHANIALTGTGGIAAAGAVTLQGKNIAVGGNISGKAVSVMGNASTAAGTVTLKNVTATGAGAGSSVDITAQTAVGAPVQITTGALTSSKGPVVVRLIGAGGGGITVNGAIKSGGNVSLNGSSGPLTGFQVTGSISAASNVVINENGAITGANTLKTGNITAGSGVTLSVQQTTGASKVTIGNVAATKGVTISDADTGAGSLNLTLGNVSGNEVLINAAAATGQVVKVTTGTLSAVNTAARGDVKVTANGKNATITTGAITAQGVLSPFSGHPSAGNAFFRDAANVDLSTSGSGAGTVTVNGGITLQGTGKHYAFSGTGSHTYTASGSTGQAVLSINAGTGNVTVTGPIKESGMGVVGAQIVASKVTLGGSMSITATAGKAKESGSYVSGSKNITYSESGARVGGAFLQVQDTTGATLGAVTLNGPTARMFVQGTGAITTGAATLNASGVTFTRTASGTDSLGKAVSYSSTESAGNAVMLLQAGTSGTPQAVNVQGAITVSGAGKAVVNVQGGTIATKGISVTEAAGKYSRAGALPTGVFSNSIGGIDPLAPQSSDHSAGGSGQQGLFGLTQGTLNGGLAGVQLQGIGPSSCGCQPLATSISVGGNISVSAVGEGEVSLTGSSVGITGGITGVATRGTVNGKGSHNFTSGSRNYAVAHTVSGSGGIMHVDIRGKQNGTSNGSSNNYTGNVTIGGAINLTGPTASVEVKSGSVTTGNITVTGSGEKITVKDVYTPSGTGSTFTLERSGVINWTGVDLQGKSGTGTVKAGNLAATGPVFAAIHIGAGSVSVGSMDVIASSGSVTLLDTRISSTPLSFTAGDAGIAVSNISGTGSAPVFTPATVTGNISLTAARDAHLLSDVNVSGYVLVTAGRNIDDPLPTDIKRFLNQDPRHNGGSSSNDISTLKLNASALALLAGGNITLNDAVLKVGTGSVPGVAGDSGAIALLATQGLASTGMLPNATLVAGGSLGLGNFTLTGNYLYMEAASYNLTGPISVPASTVVQFAPVSLPGSIGIEPGTSTSAQLNLSGSLLNLFPATTMLVGSSGTSGNVTIGTQGTITLNGGSNFFVYTTGTVTGLENILSTGLVGNLLELVNFQIPTASEIQTSNSGTTDDTTDQKKKKNSILSGDQSGDSGGTVETDDDPSGVCRG